MIGLRTMIAVAGAAIAMAPAATLADDVWIAGDLGQVSASRPTGVSVIFPTLCTQVVAMTASGDRVYLLDPWQNVWGLDANTGAVVSSTFIAFPQASAMAIHGGDLLVGGTDGWVRRFRLTDGQLLASHNTFRAVHAMTVKGDTVYVGGHHTIIQSGHARNGAYRIVGACGGAVSSMTTVGNILAIGSLDGRVYRFNPGSGQYLGQLEFAGGPAIDAITTHGAYLVAGDASGGMRWINPDTGAVAWSVNAGFTIEALATPSACPGDVNRDGSLDILDFLGFQNAFAAGSPHADADANRDLDIFDFLAFQNAFAAGCP